MAKLDAAVAAQLAAERTAHPKIFVCGRPVRRRKRTTIFTIRTHGGRELGMRQYPPQQRKPAKRLLPPPWPVVQQLSKVDPVADAHHVIGYLAGALEHCGEARLEADSELIAAARRVGRPRVEGRQELRGLVAAWIRLQRPEW
jgi:hypothetical protein